MTLNVWTSVDSVITAKSVLEKKLNYAQPANYYSPYEIINISDIHSDGVIWCLLFNSSL